MLQMKQINLETYLRDNHLLLIFAPKSHHQDYQRQIDMFRERTPALNHRDLLMFHLFEEEPGYFGNRVIAPEAACITRRRLNVQPGEFAIVLLGKNGQVQLRSDRPTHPDGIFALIDSGMRRQWGIRAKAIA